MDIWDGSLFDIYYLDTRISFQSHKDKVFKWKVNMYRHNHKQKCEWSIK